MAHCSRRDFLKTGLTAARACGTGSLPLKAARATATDWVTLGKSDVKVTRLAFGTGSFSGRVQRELGQDEFTRLVRYAYDRGIRFFETAESYGEMHKMLGVALKGIPRDSYRLMSKVTTHEGVDPQQKIDELRKLANTEYFDIMLLHWQHVASWPTDTVRVAGRDSGSRIEEGRGITRSVGARASGAAPVPGQQMARSCHDPDEPQGHHMDAEDYNTSGPGNVSEVVTHVKQVRKRGHGRDQHEAGGRGRIHKP